MKQDISILGCGWLGMALAADLCQKGYSVKGSNTSAYNFEALKNIGIKPYVLDLGNRAIDSSDFLKTDILIIAIPTKNITFFSYLINQIVTSGIQKVILTSSTSVYPFTNAIVTEDTPTISSALSQIEQLFISTPHLTTTIVRFGGLFGYNRKPGNFIKDPTQIKNPDGYVNLIHRDDCISIIEKIISTNTWNETLNACADTHPKRGEFYAKEMRKLGRPDLIIPKEAPCQYKIVSNERLKNKLNYTFKYGDLMQY